MNRYEKNFECHTLDDDGNLFFRGELPERLRVDTDGFEMLWRLHPEEYHIIQMFGRLVPTARWQQAFGADYYYTGRINRALPMPEECRPLLDWSREVVYEELNPMESTASGGETPTGSAVPGVDRDGPHRGRHRGT